jgi:hypothetical protein
MTLTYLDLTAPSGGDYMGTVERLIDGYFREDDVDVFSSGLSFSNKDIPLIEGIDENSGSYYASLDSTYWDDGVYKFRVHDINKSNETVASALFSVRCGYEVNLGEEHSIYCADIFYQKDQINLTDEYTVSWFKNAVQASGITSPTIQVINRSDGTDLIVESVMDQIGSTNYYSYTESVNRQISGNSYIMVAKAFIDEETRTFTSIQGRDA